MRAWITERLLRFLDRVASEAAAGCSCSNCRQEGA